VIAGIHIADDDATSAGILGARIPALLHQCRRWS
jgi:hypothetical protein